LCLGAFFVVEIMPTIVDTYIKDGETINVYESGAHYNVTRKHLVKAPESALITPEKSAKYKEQMAEQKRDAIMRGAGKALERIQSGEWSTPNKIDVVEALAEAIMEKALNPDNAKQVDAARFILQEGGMAETQTKTNTEAQQFADLASAAGQLVAFLRDLHNSGPVIDVTAQDVPALDTDIRNE
jgi:Rps23 Pro-64 3,4-dihydroxylase Tpa1-like proline 4-hydroxylase